MATTCKRILVAIRDLHRTPRGQLGKAAALARAAGARIELFHVIDDPDPAAGWPETSTAELTAKRRAVIVDRKQRRLEQFARDPSLRGLTVECAVSWDHPPHEAILRRARRLRADLVIAATHHHRAAARLLLRNTDWELIRHCPTPLLLVRSDRAYRKPPVIAAVDPFHQRPAGLDARLLAAGRGLARLLHGQLHVFHAYMPLLGVAPALLGAAPLMMLPPEVQAAQDASIARAIDRLADRAAIPRARRHVRMGDVSTELRAVARETAAGLVVMGAVSRSALGRLFIGNTAERVLDGLDCDVLIVKPRGFRSRVALRPAAAVVRPTPRRHLPAAPGYSAPASSVTTMRVMLPAV